MRVVLSGLQPQPRAVLTRMHALGHVAIAADVPGFEQAVPAARRLLAPTGATDPAHRGA
jgi:hypothetical protein